MQKTVEKQSGILDFAFEKFLQCRYPVLVDTHVYQPAIHNKFHNHEYPQIWYCLSGKYLHRVNDRVYKCEPGSVVIIPPGVYHTFSIPDGELAKIFQLNLMYDTFLDYPIDRYMNTIANLFIPPFSNELKYSFPTYCVLSQESRRIFEECTSWLASIQFNQANVDLNHIFSKLEMIFSLPEFALPEKLHAAVCIIYKHRVLPLIRILSYLNHHYADKIVEDNIIQEAAICRSDLYKYFKQFIGYSCFEYLRWLRLNYAAVYMAYTTYPLSYISDVCGFANPPHMSFTFSKYYGIAPSKFREGKLEWLARNGRKKRFLQDF